MIVNRLRNIQYLIMSFIIFIIIITTPVTGTITKFYDKCIEERGTEYYSFHQETYTNVWYDDVEDVVVAHSGNHEIRTYNLNAIIDYHAHPSNLVCLYDRLLHEYYWNRQDYDRVDYYYYSFTPVYRDIETISSVYVYPDWC